MVPSLTLRSGLSTLFLTLGLACGLLLQPKGPELFSYLYDHWVPLVSATIAFAMFQSTWVWAWSFFSGELLAIGGRTGNPIYDVSPGCRRQAGCSLADSGQFFIGRPLNPTPPLFPNFDIKTFNEVRPGIIGWVLLNIACASEQYLRLGKLTDSMIIVLVAEGWYCFDSLWNEASLLMVLVGSWLTRQSGILTQMDITTDGFGYMLAFGNLTWVPMVYGLQARYLAFHPVELGPVNSALISALIITGVVIFRQSNSEKFEFRNGRNPKSEAQSHARELTRSDLTFLETERGTKLLTSGWWGRSRHPNYFGDWLMA